MCFYSFISLLIKLILYLKVHVFSVLWFNLIHLFSLDTFTIFGSSIKLIPCLKVHIFSLLWFISKINSMFESSCFYFNLVKLAIISLRTSIILVRYPNWSLFLVFISKSLILVPDHPYLSLYAFKILVVSLWIDTLLVCLI